MADRDPIAQLLERVEHPVAPDRRFRDELLAELLAELGEASRGDPAGGRPKRRLSPTWRKALTVAAALAIALGGLALIRPLLRLSETPEVPASVREIGPFPVVPFGGTVVVGPRDQTAGLPISDVSYVSQFSWSVAARGDALLVVFGDIGAVSRDGDVVTFYDPRLNTTREVGVRSAAIAPSFSPAKFLTWNGTQAFSWAASCGAGTIVGTEPVDGIEAVRVHCPDVKVPVAGWGGGFRSDADVWVDPTNGIVVRIETAGKPRAPEAPIQADAPEKGQRWELTDLQIGDVTAATYTPPSDAIDATDQTVLTSVRIGQPMPPVELPLMDGGTTTLSGTHGKPTAIYFWDLSCVGAGCSMTAQIEAFAARDDVDVVVVVDPTIYEIEKRVHDMLDPEHVSVPVALDTDGAARGLIARGYSGGSDGNTVLLLDADGNLQGAYAGNYTDGLPGILDALAAGEPLPRPGPDTDAQLP